MKWLIFFCNALLLGCSAHSLQSVPPRAAVTSLQPVIDLIDNEAAVITVTRAAGSRGNVHPLLARALGASNNDPANGDQREYWPSDVERRLTAMLQSSRDYAALQRMLNPSQDIEPRASGSFSIDYSNFSENTARYGNNKIRKVYTYEIGLSFRLLRTDGKLAYERKFVTVDRQICIFREGEACLEIRTGQPIHPEQRFLRTLTNAYHDAITETVYGLDAWAEVLRHLKATVTVYHGSGRKLEQEQGAIWLRQKQQADHHYLYISLPTFRVRLDRLYSDLEARGERLNEADRIQLKNDVATALRSRLDHYLQQHLSQSERFEHAGIFLLPDPEAIWFRDALSLHAAHLINTDTMEAASADPGAEESDAFGVLCDRVRQRTGNDVCLSINASYARSATEMAAAKGGLADTRLSSIVSALLFDPNAADKNERYFPTRERAKVDGMGYSDHYVKIMDASGQYGEEPVYLREALQNAVDNLASKMAENIVLTFQKTIGDG